jgi:hypothetical protein
MDGLCKNPADECQIASPDPCAWLRAGKQGHRQSAHLHCLDDEAVLIVELRQVNVLQALEELQRLADLLRIRAEQQVRPGMWVVVLNKLGDLREPHLDARVVLRPGIDHRARIHFLQLMLEVATNRSWTMSDI